MATAIREHRRHVPHRPPMMRQRGGESGTALALGMVALLTVGVWTVVLSGQFIDVSIPRFLAHMVDPVQPTRPVDGAVPMKKKLAAAATAQPAAPEAGADTLSASALAAGPLAEDAPEMKISEAPQAEAAPAAQSLSAGAKARIANTDGQGVVLYAAPQSGARQPAGFLEGTAVTVLETSGTEWARVQSATKKVGWVHAEFLAPAE